MNNIKKTVSSFLVLGLLASSGFFAVNALTRSFNTTKATAPTTLKRSAKSSVGSLSADDFSSEEEANYEELGVSITQSTLTDTSQSLTVSFRSKTLAGYKTAIGNYVVEIDDPNYTGDDQNPAPEGYDKFNEETGLPEFEGKIAFIVGSVSENNKHVYLPTTFTKAGKFTAKITTIGAGCVSQDGAEFNGQNAWSLNKITNIYIPNSIEKVEAGAFTNVPSSGVTIHYEGSELPSTVFESGWCDNLSAVNASATSYNKKANKTANAAAGKVDLPDALGRPINFILGCTQDANNPKVASEECNRPLVIQYDKVTNNGGAETRETIFEELPLTNTTQSPYDSCGKLSAMSYTRLFGYKLGPNESIDDSSIIFHNLMKADATGVVDTSKTYFARPTIGYSEKQDITNLVSYKASMNSTFAGYSMFTLKMDKNLSITSERYPEPHSLYLDVKTDIYEQNKAKIEKGETKIRYSLYNLYNSSFHFQYIGKDNELKDIVLPVKSLISYQSLDSNKGNLVSVLLKDSAIAPDFAPEKVRLFELQDITIQMDLLTTSDSGSTSILGKSSISYRFAYITVIDTDKNISVFNWNMFLIIFFIAYVVVYAAAAFITYKVMKEKFKNDEFRRVNDKKFLKQALLGGGGLGIVLAAVLFIFMRTVGFKNTIVVFNPTDPLLIAFSIVALIIVGYFIVYLIKLIKAERERRKAIRLKLNEDVADDGTN